MHQDRLLKLTSTLKRRQSDLTVLMDRVHKAHNLSAILRNCDAVGVFEIHAVAPERGLKIHDHTSAGTDKWVKVVQHAGIQNAAEVLKDRGFRLLGAHPGPGATDFREVDYTQPTAIMMGAEKMGLSDEGRGLTDEHIAIPMMGMVHSLNVSVATAIILFEAFRQRQALGMYDESHINPVEFERTLFEWAYPRVARYYRKKGESYPSLDPDGGFISPNQG
jgi:tRNA (guanosine-2'-O-)-methyltransferase